MMKSGPTQLAAYHLTALAAEQKGTTMHQMIM